jgi:hypothetical protein
MTSKPFSPKLLIGVVLLVTAALLRFWTASELSQLPVDYANETRYSAESRYRNSPAGDWQNITLVARRVDQTQVIAGPVAVIQADLHWFTDSNQVIFENSGLYGVDRHTRMNVSAYGDVSRTGFFLFPPHISRSDFNFWDPMFIGARHATFERMDTISGLSVYVFKYSGIGMDETAGYTYLPDVPELYHTLTDGQGTLWIEPLSGVLVDYEEQGTSYFVNTLSRERIASFYEWSDRYTPDTRTNQIALARTSLLRIMAIEIWLPGGLALAGLIFLGWMIFGGNKARVQV